MKATHQLLVTPVSDPMCPSALLRGAAAFLRHYGWTQSQFYDLVAKTDANFPPADACGAIITAATGRCPISGIFTDGQDDDTETDAAIRAMRVYAVYLNDCYPTPDNVASDFAVLTPSAIDVIGDWNDEGDRSLNEVIETLRDAADGWDRARTTGGAR